MRLEDFIKRADELILKADHVLATKHSEYDFVDEGLFREFRSSSLSFLASVFGKSHTYYTEFDISVKHPRGSYTSSGKGILLACRSEMAGGWVQTTKGLVSAEIFSEFLDMATYLLESGYKDPSAVVAGSVLEEHLRQLCNSHGIPVTTERDGTTIPGKRML